MKEKNSTAAKAVKRSVIIVAIIALAILAGFVGEHIYRTIEEANHPVLYSEYVTKYAKEYDLPEAVLYAVIKTESGFDETARSSRGAMGLMQLLPDTYEWICTREKIPYDAEKIADPETNIRCGAAYLAYLKNEFVIWETVYAAYNAGHGRVREWLADEDIADNGHLIAIPYPETETYVSRVSDAVKIYTRILEEQSKN